MQGDLGADAAIGVDFEQQGMAQSAVDHVRLADAAAQAIQARFHLGDHAFVNDACARSTPGSLPRPGWAAAISGSLRSIKMPGISVRKTSFSARRWAATAAAAVSALTLSQPRRSSRPGPPRESPAPRRRHRTIRSAPLSTRVTCPTRPRSIGSAFARPARQLLAEQDFAASRSAGRRPGRPAGGSADDAGVDFVEQAHGRRYRGWPRRCSGGLGLCAVAGRHAAMARSMGLPPPWTRIGRMPTVSMKTTSCSVASSAAASSMALPPSLMTVSRSRNIADVAEGFDQGFRFADGVVHRPTHH